MRPLPTAPAALLLLLALPGTALAYSPPAAEVLTQMQNSWRRTKPVEVRLGLPYTRDPVPEVTLRVPSDTDTAPSPGPSNMPGLVPFSSLLGGQESIAGRVPSLLEPDARTSLTRLDAAVCYLLEGRRHRLWLRKAGLVPLRIEVLLEDGTWAATSYRGLVLLEDRVPYPAETVYEGKGDPRVVERLLNTPEPAPQ